MTADRSPAPLKARILNIQRMSTEDGPGLRTTVFFKGCSLRCRWCHNPESISARTQVYWIADRCMGCGTCAALCPEIALTLTEAGVRIDRQRCSGCGQCAAACPSTAMERLGEEWTLDDLLREVLKDRAYFASEGGVTLSGGEPALQAEFVTPFLQQLRHQGIHTALDTAGRYDREVLDHLLPHTSLVLYDLKLSDPKLHKVFTGHLNTVILKNAMRAAELLQAGPKGRRMWIRTPIIPGATDPEGNIRGIGRFIAEHLKGAVSRWELCAFNNLCKDKYLRLGQAWAYDGCPLPERQEMERLADVARKSGVDPAMVHWSGATRLENQARGKKAAAERK